MKKYIVTFKGHKKVFANSYDDAKRKVEGDLEFIHPNFNMKFESIGIFQEEEEWVKIIKEA